jgi:hypothetical protein
VMGIVIVASRAHATPRNENIITITITTSPSRRIIARRPSALPPPARTFFAHYVSGAVRQDRKGGVPENTLVLAYVPTGWALSNTRP